MHKTVRWYILTGTYIVLGLVMESDRDRFLRKTLKLDNGCIKWTASCDSKGYGQFMMCGVPMRAHRAAYILFKGPIPKRGIIMHSCDNRACVNPKHLSIGTQSENLVGMMQRQRRKYTLTENLARAIYADERPQAAVAKDYGITQPQVARIKQGLTWAWATGAKPRKPGHFKGARSYQAKLTPRQVRAVRKSSDSCNVLAKRYGLSSASIAKVRKGITYKEVK